jgi:hypothetical protein
MDLEGDPHKHGGAYLLACADPVTIQIKFSVSGAAKGN